MKKLLTYLILWIAVPLIVVGGAVLFEDRQYAWISLCVILLAFVPFFWHFEKKQNKGKELILIASMAALSVVGRILFAPLPGFKPVTALVVITAMYFGSEVGFMTGAVSALISNFYFGQGPWTPFQMFTWGLIGFIAGMLDGALKRNRIVLAVYGILSGIAFSLLMDIWTVLWADGHFNPLRYCGAVLSAIPFTIIYAVSNVVFLLLFAKPIGKVLERIQIKYEIRRVENRQNK